MSRLKNPTLRNRTEELCEHANNFEETFQIGCELQNIGRLIQGMSLHIRDLQGGKTESLNIPEREFIADCMISNRKGLWALLHCGHCGYVDVIYPIRINGEECTPEECKKLMEEITKYDKAGEQSDERENQGNTGQMQWSFRVGADTH